MRVGRDNADFNWFRQDPFLIIDARLLMESDLESTSAPQMRAVRQQAEIAFKKKAMEPRILVSDDANITGLSLFLHCRRAVIRCRGGRRGVVFGIGARQAARFSYPRSVDTQNARARSAQVNESRSVYARYRAIICTAKDYKTEMAQSANWGPSIFCPSRFRPKPC